jgi:PhzF family phenazine biosynthesis protein
MIKEIEFQHIHAFSDTNEYGNPAGVVMLDQWENESQLSRIAQAIGLPITAFVVRRTTIELKWYSRSGKEVTSMCGHGTLAASKALFEMDNHSEKLRFETVGGPVFVHKEGEDIFLNLPAWELAAMSQWPELSDALSAMPSALFSSHRDILAIFESEDLVKNMQPDFDKLLKLGHHGFIVSAPGKDVDCVSRFFCPSFGIGEDEDAVTGSAHCTIVPYWAHRLDRTVITSFQASRKGGLLKCRLLGDRVEMGSRAFVVGIEAIMLAS